MKHLKILNIIKEYRITHILCVSVFLRSLNFPSKFSRLKLTLFNIKIKNLNFLYELPSQVNCEFKYFFSSKNVLIKVLSYGESDFNNSRTKKDKYG